jgi:hypothetical protein
MMTDSEIDALIQHVIAAEMRKTASPLEIQLGIALAKLRNRRIVLEADIVRLSSEVDLLRVPDAVDPSSDGITSASKLIECPVCFGSGYDSDGSCHTCAGFGAVYFTEEK